MDMAGIMRLEDWIRAATTIDHAAVQAGAVQFAALPAGVEIRDLEAFADHRRRFRGAFSTESVADFSAYAARVLGNTPEGAAPPCFIDAQRMTASIIFDLGSASAPLHCQHTATLTEKATPLWVALAEADGKRRDQRGLVEFLQDWAGLWTAADASGNAIEPARALAAIRKIEIKASGGQTSEAGNMSNSRSTFAKVEAEAANGLPAVIEFNHLLYPDLAARAVLFDLHVLPDEKAPALVLRMRGRARLVEELGREFGDVVRRELAGRGLADLPALLGTLKV